MFPTLEAELARRRMTKGRLAQKIGMTASTLSSKLNGKGRFTLADARAIKDAIGADMPLEELFHEEVSKPA